MGQAQIADLSQSRRGEISIRIYLPFYKVSAVTVEMGIALDHPVNLSM